MIKWYYNNFYPIDKFKDCSRGTQIQKFNAYKYNQKNADILIFPMLNWLTSGLLSLMFTYFFQIITRIEPTFVYLTALSAVLMTVCIIGFIIISIAFIFLNGCNISWSDSSINKDWYN